MFDYSSVSDLPTFLTACKTQKPPVLVYTMCGNKFSGTVADVFTGAVRVTQADPAGTILAEWLIPTAQITAVQFVAR